LQNRSYGYTPAGDIELITDSVKSVSYYYEYDKLHRLISETTSDGSIGLTPSILELDYDDPDHIHAVSSATHWQISPGGGGQPATYTYDFNGNLETGPDFTYPDAIADRTFDFNSDNMPEQVSHSSFGTVNFLYDGEGKRAKKEGPAGTTYYLSNEFEIINGIATRYIFAGNLRIAKVTDGIITYFHKDHLGSSTVMTDTSGIALETGGYFPYGMGRENPGITLSNYKFTDQELDTESGLYNYDARLYDPVIGRFISPDSIVPRPFDPQSLNRYSYCRNNPLIFTDPTGHYDDGDEGDTEAFGDDPNDGNDTDGTTNTDNQDAKDANKASTKNNAKSEIEENKEKKTSKDKTDKSTIVVVILDTKYVTTQAAKDMLNLAIHGDNFAKTALGIAVVTTAVPAFVAAVDAIPAALSVVLANPQTITATQDFVKSMSPGTTPTPNWPGVYGAATGNILGTEKW